MALIGKYRSKIKSAKNIAKITKAMQFVAASKMKRAQDAAMSGKEYAQGLTDLSQLLSAHLDEKIHPLLGSNEKQTETVKLIVLVAPQKGLCGSLVTNLTRFTAEIISKSERTKTEVIVIGNKAKQISRRLNLNIVAEFDLGLSHPKYDSIPPISRLIEERFVTGSVERVDVIYADFVSTMQQNPKIATLLPLEISETDVELKTNMFKKEYLFEPNPKSIVEPLLGMYLETELYQILLEAYASEQSSRMVAMKNATDNATSLIEDLTVEFNKVRQAAITSEILDIGNARAIVSA